MRIVTHFVLICVVGGTFLENPFKWIKNKLKGRTNKESTVVEDIIPPGIEFMTGSGKNIVRSFSEFLEQCPEDSVYKFNIFDQFGLPRAVPDMTLKDKLLESIPPLIFEDTDGSPSPYHPLDPKILGAGGQSAVFALPGHMDRWVLKYSWYCGDNPYETIDPLLVEVYHLTKVNQLADEKLVNEVLYYSRDIEYEVGFTKFPVRNGIAPLSDECHPQSIRGSKGLTPTLRYLITERVGISLMDYIKRRDGRRMPFLDAMDVGIKIIQMLQKLHLLNLLHGDLHPGNIAIEDPKILTITGSTKFVFIDLGRCKEIDVRTDCPHNEDTPVDGVHVDTLAGIPLEMRQIMHFQLSLHESLSKKLSFRDEVFRALNVVAFLIHGYQYLRTVSGIANAAFSKRRCDAELEAARVAVNVALEGGNVEAFLNAQAAVKKATLSVAIADEAIRVYFKHKGEDNIFDTELSEPGTGLETSFTVARALGVSRNPRFLKSIKRLFDQVLENARNTGIKDKPDYDFIIKKLKGIVRLVEKHSSSCTKLVREEVAEAAEEPLYKRIFRLIKSPFVKAEESLNEPPTTDHSLDAHRQRRQEERSKHYQQIAKADDFSNWETAANLKTRIRRVDNPDQ